MLFRSLDGPLEYVGGVLDFDQLTFNGDTCDGDGVTGSVRLRDDAGRCYDFALGDDCDACGEVTGPDGTSLGEACADVGDVGDDLAERYLTPWR